jgi:phosphocarrier protein
LDRRITLVELSYLVTDEAGIHARPAGRIVKKAQGMKSEITLTKGEKTVSLKKLFALMGLAVKKGETVLLKFEGEDEELAAAEIKKAMESEGL